MVLCGGGFLGCPTIWASPRPMSRLVAMIALSLVGGCRRVPETSFFPRVGIEQLLIGLTSVATFWTRSESLQTVLETSEGFVQHRRLLLQEDVLLFHQILRLLRLSFPFRLQARSRPLIGQCVHPARRS